MATHIDAFVQDHDPENQSDYTFRFRLADDETVTAATVTVIDIATGIAPSPATDLILADTSFGLMSDEITWGVTTWVTGGTNNKLYYLHCQITTNSSPLPRIFNRTMKLLCAEQ